MIKKKINGHGFQDGFTLLEVAITVSIMGILAAVVTPTSHETQTEAKLVMSKASISDPKQGFINLYLIDLSETNAQMFPDRPADHKMTFEWANSTIPCR